MPVTWNLLTASDFLTTFTFSFNDWVYGRTPSIKKSAYAFLVSMISRFISDNVAGTGVLGGKYTSKSSKNQIVVAILGGMRSLWMKQGVLRGAMDQVSADLTAEWLLQSLGQVYGISAETDTKTFDWSINDFLK